MQLKSVPFMTPALRTLMDHLNNAGYDAYVVGGSVRDAVIGRPSNDVDLSTSATPVEVKQLLGACPETFTLYPTGVDHGTWTVGVGGETYEVTSYRRDVETDGRRAVVEFSRSMTDDAYRRDFTMNALYMDMDGVVYDPTGEGVDDLMARRVRFVGNADERCTEDYLRILRLFRFHANLGTGLMDHTALNAVRRKAGGLRTVSGERVWSELKKLLAAPDPTHTLYYMEYAGVLREVFRGYKTDTNLVRSVVTAELFGGYAPRWERRYCALAGRTCGVPFPAAKSEKRHQQLVSAAMQNGNNVVVTAYKLKDRDAALDAYVMNCAAVNPTTCRDVGDELSMGMDSIMPLTADDLMRAGVPAGPELGKKLRHAEEVFVTSNLCAGRDRLFDSVM